MKKGTITVVYDNELRLEAYHFEGIVRAFPNHFHEYYVIGFIENGKRRLSCKNQEYTIKKGDILLFNPCDNHACTQSDDGTLDYRGFNISKETMLDLAEAVTGNRELPGFSKSVIHDEEIACYLLQLHKMVIKNVEGFLKEESLIILLSNLIQKCGQSFENCISACRDEIEKACVFIEQHYMDKIYLDEISRCAGLSKSTLLRAFTKSKGVSPYRYLAAIRINEAKKLLEKGISPLDAAYQTGFSDQSHFTNYFSDFIGIAPGVYRSIFFDKDSK